MGLVEVVRHLATIRRVQAGLEALLRDRRPDVVVLIDYPGFNLRFARIVKRYGIPVLYYISPQVWAWNASRVRRMKNLVDRMKVVFPFEVEVYEREGIDVEFVGHPIVEQIDSTLSREDFLARTGLSAGGKILGLFPGSRMQEIDHVLPIILESGRRLQDDHGIQVAVSVAPNLERTAVERQISDSANVVLVHGMTYELMRYADVAIVTSGTATLETAWFTTPMIVVYRTSPVTFWIGRMLVDIPYIGLVNIVAGKKIVPELIQRRLTVGHVVDATNRILLESEYEQEMRKELSVIKERLGSPGASQRVAESVLALGRAA